MITIIIRGEGSAPERFILDIPENGNRLNVQCSSILTMLLYELTKRKIRYKVRDEF